MTFRKLPKMREEKPEMLVAYDTLASVSELIGLSTTKAFFNDNSYEALKQKILEKRKAFAKKLSEGKLDDLRSNRDKVINPFTIVDPLTAQFKPDTFFVISPQERNTVGYAISLFSIYLLAIHKKQYLPIYYQNDQTQIRQASERRTSLLLLLWCIAPLLPTDILKKDFYEVTKEKVYPIWHPNEAFDLLFTPESLSLIVLGLKNFSVLKDLLSYIGQAKMERILSLPDFIQSPDNLERYSLAQMRHLQTLFQEAYPSSEPIKKYFEDCVLLAGMHEATKLPDIPGLTVLLQSASAEILNKHPILCEKIKKLAADAHTFSLVALLDVRRGIWGTEIVFEGSLDAPAAHAARLRLWMEVQKISLLRLTFISPQPSAGLDMAIVLAANVANWDVVKSLLSNKVTDLFARHPLKEMSTLDFVIASDRLNHNERLELVQLILANLSEEDRKKIVNGKDMQGVVHKNMGPLALAIRVNHKIFNRDLVRLLLEQGADASNICEVYGVRQSPNFCSALGVILEHNPKSISRSTLENLASGSDPELLDLLKEKEPNPSEQPRRPLSFLSSFTAHAPVRAPDPVPVASTPVSTPKSEVSLETVPIPKLPTLSPAPISRSDSNGMSFWFGIEEQPVSTNTVPNDEDTEEVSDEVRNFWSQSIPS